MTTDEFFTTISQGIASLLGSSIAGLLVSTALTMFYLVIIFRVAIIGAEWMFMDKVNERELKVALVRIMFVSVVLHGWTTPIPFFGVSAPGLVLNETQTLTRQLDNGQGQHLQDTLNTAYAQIERPGWTTPLVDTAFYFAVVVFIAFMQLVAALVTTVGIIVAAVCVLLGPLFVVALLWPATEHWYRGLLNAFVQYSSYTVVAAAIIYIASFVLIAFWQRHPGPIALDDLPIIGLQFIIIVGSLVLTMFQIPSIVSHIFGGHSGVAVIRARSV